MRKVIIVDTLAVAFNAFVVAVNLWSDHPWAILNLLAALLLAGVGSWTISGWRQRDRHEARINQLVTDIIRLEARLGVNHE